MSKKSLFTIPEKPVDQYRLDWWHISVSSCWFYVYKMHAIYHVNTPWSAYCSDGSHGVDIVDDWMYYKDEYKHAECRWCGWGSVIKDSEYWSSCFLTKTEAYAEVKKRLNEYLDTKSKQIEDVKQMLNLASQERYE